MRILEIAYDMEYLIETTPLLLTTLLRNLDILSFSQAGNKGIWNIGIHFSLLLAGGLTSTVQRGDFYILSISL